MQHVELLSPAGSLETALAAFEAGADAVYLGLDVFSARAEAVNFSSDDLRHLLDYAHRDAAHPRRVYVTFNTLIREAEWPEAAEKLALLEDLSPDGLIVQDLGVAAAVKRHFPTLALHASTQMAAHNLEGVLALKDLGFSRVVLARELSLEDIRTIAARSGVEIECFVHGALCYSVSGLCLFSAMEKERSGNRGRCAYCCRMACTLSDGSRTLPFSMRDLRLDDRLAELREAGVASLKIEGRMKSPLYVASVTRRYRELLDRGASSVSRADLETVFSRRTTSLYLDGYDAPSPIDTDSLGHLGTPIGTVKRITKDREGRTWLRFHTNRAIERHDGLQFAAPDGGRPLGLGVGAMRLAISRKNVFEVTAGSDVEVELSPDIRPAPGDTIFMSASNVVKRRFPTPSFRPSDYPGGMPLDMTLHLTKEGTELSCGGVMVRDATPLTSAEHPERTLEAARRALSKLGDTAWKLRHLSVVDHDRLFVPASILNDLRRQLVQRLDECHMAKRAEKIAAVMGDVSTQSDYVTSATPVTPLHIVKVSLADALTPLDVCDERIIDIGHTGEVPELDETARLALPLLTRESDFGDFRLRVKELVDAGYVKWEVADLAGLRLLKSFGITDLTADWSLYAFNRSALGQLAALGIRRVVAAPENNPDNLENLAALAAHSGIAVEFLTRQMTPLFISFTRPAANDVTQMTGPRGEVFTVYLRDGFWVTTRPEARTFTPPTGARYLRADFSWDNNTIQ